MERERAYDALEEFNRLYKQMDGIYHRYARRRGLADAAFWILYALWEAGAPRTQRELCGSWASPPQTVNSALKGLERQGLLALAPRPGSRRDKEMALTPAGRALARRTVQPLMEAERRALEALGETGRQALLRLTRQYVQALEGGMEGLPAGPGQSE